MSYQRVVMWLLAVLVVGGLAVACAFTGDPAGEGLFVLACSELEQMLTPDEITVFYVTLEQDAAPSTQVQVSLETLAGADWKAALCYEEKCFMHDGREKLVHTMSVGHSTAFEIKMFVPPEAVSGDTKTVKMSVTPGGASRQAAALELIGYLP